MKAMLLNAPELKLLADTVRPARAALVVGAEGGCSAEEYAPSACFEVYTVDALVMRAVTVTPILEEILRTRPPLHFGLRD